MESLVSDDHYRNEIMLNNLRNLPRDLENKENLERHAKNIKDKIARNDQTFRGVTDERFSRYNGNSDNNYER